METFKAHLLDKDTLEQKQAVDNLLAQQQAGQHAASDVTQVVGSGGNIRTGGEPAHLSDGIYFDTEIYKHDGRDENEEGGKESGRKAEMVEVGAEVEQKTSTAAHTCVFDAITSCPFGTGSKVTVGTCAFIRTLLDRPVCDVLTLQARGDTIRRMTRREHIMNLERSKHIDMRRLEVDVAWAFDDADETSGALYEMAYFTPWFARFLNRVPVALSALNAYKIVAFPLIGALTPIICFVVPYMVLRWKIGLPLSFKAYLWIMYRSFIANNALDMPGGGPSWARHLSCAVALLFYFQSIFTSLEVSRALRVVCKCVDSRMRNVATFFTEAAHVVKANWDEGIRGAFFPDVYRPSDAHLDQALADTHGQHGPGFWSMVKTFGSSLSRYRCFDKEHNRVMARAYYATDAVMQLARLVRSEGFQTVEWVHDNNDVAGATGSVTSGGVAGEEENCSRPYVELRDMWHPCLRPDAAVTNDVCLGVGPQQHQQQPQRASTSTPAPNMLLTGPNAGGKSMLIKASVVSVLLAQSLGIAPCRKRARLTPFRFVSSQINVPDVKGSRSLFEEEMHRAKQNLDFLRNNPSSKAFIVIDEIFSSTNPVEGISGAYSVALNLAKHPQATCIISTHYTYLSRLHKQASFVNMQMPVKVLKGTTGSSRTPDDDSKEDDVGGGGKENKDQQCSEVALTFRYPYKLVPGVCRQYIALELLRKNGFDQEVLDEAFSIKKAITSE